MLGVAIATLHAWRRVGKPPAFIRLGRAVRYRPSTLRELIRQGGYANRGGGACLLGVKDRRERNGPGRIVDEREVLERLRERAQGCFRLLPGGLS